MILEAVGGGWGSIARGVWSELAKSNSLATGELQTERSSAIFLRQRLSMTLHRENARACLKRFAPELPLPTLPSHYNYHLQLHLPLSLPLPAQFIPTLTPNPPMPFSSPLLVLALARRFCLRRLR